MSGLKDNLSKSFIVGINYEVDKIQRLADSTTCSLGEWPLTNMGLPLGGNPSTKGGRLILIQSVLSTIPPYFMSLFRMPGKVAIT